MADRRPIPTAGSQTTATRVRLRRRLSGARLVAMSPRARLALPLLAAAASLIPASCGGGPPSSVLVNPKRSVPINSLGVEDGGSSFLLSTNRGLFRVRNGRAVRVRARLKAPDGTGPIGNSLALVDLGGGRLLGSGHPDKRTLAPSLGLIRSDDGGRHWRSVARYGLSDMHVLRLAHGRLYAADAVLGGVVISGDGGRTWTKRTAPPAVVLDLVVNPDDANELVISYDNRLMSSEDRGKTWLPLIGADSARLAWPSADVLYSAESTGNVFVSGNQGESWTLIGFLDGVPWKLEATDNEHLFAAMSDASIMESTDGGRSWDTVFEP